MTEKKKERYESLKGNKFGVKLKDAEVRQAAFRQYCEWIATGKPKDAWWFEHDEYSCTSKTMERYISENPNEFPAIKKEVARCKAYAKWFSKGEDMVKTDDKCNPAIYQMIMRNMFDWDKENSGQKETTEPIVKTLARRWRGN